MFSNTAVPPRANYAVCPGEFLTEWMEETATSTERLAVLLDVTSATVAAVLTGATAIDEELAPRLSAVTTIPSYAWLRYEKAYHADLLRLGLRRCSMT